MEKPPVFRLRLRLRRTYVALFGYGSINRPSVFVSLRCDYDVIRRAPRHFLMVSEGQKDAIAPSFCSHNGVLSE